MLQFGMSRYVMGVKEELYVYIYIYIVQRDTQCGFTEEVLIST